MAYPFHPSRSDNDLSFSVLYDDVDVLNAIAIIEDLDRGDAIPPAPPWTFRVRVIYMAKNGGVFDGPDVEWVVYSTTPTHVPDTGTPTMRIHHWEDEEGNIVDPATVPISKKTIFYAIFEPTNGEIVTYTTNPEGFLVGNTTEFVAWGEFPKNPPTPTPYDSDHIFRYWTVNGVKANPLSYKIEVGMHVTFNAEYRTTPANPKTIHYNCGEGGYLVGVTDEVLDAYDRVGYPPYPYPYDGYEFAYWEITTSTGTLVDRCYDPDLAGYTGEGYQVGGNNMVMTAIFKKKDNWQPDPDQTYTVYFNHTPGGELIGSTQQTVKAGEKLKEVPLTMAATNKVFAGWLSDGVVVNPREVAITKDTVFTACFKNQYTVVLSIDPEDGGAFTDGSKVKTIQVIEGDKIAATIVDELTAATNYALDGFYIGETKINLADHKVTGDENITVKFVRDAYVVTYNIAGPGTFAEGSAPITETVTPGAKPANVPTPVANEGAIFQGWTDGTEVKADPDF